MTTYSIPTVTGFATRVANLFTRFKAAMLALGYDATEDITALTSGAAALPVTDEEQEHAKTVQHQQTDAVDEEVHAAYLNASQTLNTASSRFGKNSEEAAEASRLRAGCDSKSSAPNVGAFVAQVAAYLTNHKAALIAKHFDPTAKIAELTALSTSLVTDKGTQEQAKEDRGDATTDVVSAKDSLYELANNSLETAIGLFPADSEFVAEARRIRGEVRGRAAAPQPPPAPPPAPPPTQPTS